MLDSLVRYRKRKKKSYIFAGSTANKAELQMGSEKQKTAKKNCCVNAGDRLCANT